MLRTCVASLFDSTYQPDEVLIVGRTSDSATAQVIAELQAHTEYGERIRYAWVSVPGHIPPVETGFRTASGDIIAVIDDDVTVTQGWLEQLVSDFADPSIGIVGGRVIVPGHPQPQPKGRPGQLSWYGQYGGNIGTVDGTEKLEVISVMEGNCAWRREAVEAVRFDSLLNFDDASMYGLDLGLQTIRNDFKVLYDPQAIVYHHVAPRAPGLERRYRPQRRFTYTRNYTYIMLKHLSGLRRGAFLVWWFLFTGRSNWGLAGVIVETLLHGFGRRREMAAALAGKIEGIRLWLKQYNQSFRKI